MEMRPSSLAILCQVLLPHGCWCPAEARSCSKPPAQRLPPQLCAPGLWPPAPKDPKASPAELQRSLLPPPAISTMEESPITEDAELHHICLVHFRSLSENCLVITIFHCSRLVRGVPHAAGLSAGPAVPWKMPPGARGKMCYLPNYSRMAHV
ncbi:hypothetical protein AOLI_G00060760 [Acnodon oligacanthus]